ncbi:adenosylcobinamide-phosphate synthase CbiB [Wenxinia saemankumensis]|uniref:Cobalamin biosynthesis protein CobD n=1 Tax=Wenxinia saemankumensis TaxID=1447782 RepID=A0A1M6EFY5_9RHOB|nr:adenosylcobinamide-phosphate synthase CbiB [Wenxinia saemankumensis]SHI84299.1 adenosylcobinamide-phosphate synthase [Wenxinia saemankumensis]
MTGALLAALLLDAALGEPRALWDRWPHPTILMGRAVAALDRRMNGGTRPLLAGAGAYALLAGGALLLGSVLAALPGQLVDIALVAILLAQRSLVEHVAAVAQALRQSVPEGRRAVARIVGRDTAAMDAPAIARAAIESAAENFSDGIVAPAFWFLIGGLPGLLLYKVTNTADSMIGYRTPRHERFGKVAARADDVLNWIPARLTALAFRALAPGARWRDIADEARLHRSPNAGWPEAALARVLDVALSGPRSYHGRMRDFPFVNPRGRREAGPEEIDAAVRTLWRVWGGAVALLAVALTAAALLN